MNKSLLVTRPNDDQTTNYLFYWSKKVVEFALKKRFNVYDLSGNKANKTNFESYLKSKKPGVIFLNGHGNTKFVYGYGSEIILNSNKLPKIDNCVIYARSCDSALSLGPRLAENGTNAFIGYTRKFVFAYTQTKITKPLEDKLAEPFLEPSNLIVNTLIKGHSAFEAHLRSKKAMYKNFRKMISSSASFEQRFASRWLWGNIKSQVVLGNMKAGI